MRNDGYYVTVSNEGKKYLCDVTYLKTIAKIKKAFNTQFENTYATIHIVKVENGIETIVYVKQFDALRKTNWLNTERKTEAGYNDLASYEPNKEEVESQPAQAEKEIVEPNTIKGRYIAIQMKMKNADNEMIDRYYLFDVSRETNKINIMKFTNSFVGESMAVAYIVDEYRSNVIIRSKKVYTPHSRNYWIRKNDVLSKTFLDDFRK